MFLLSGIKYFGGAPIEKLPFKWNHVCISVKYTQEGAERLIYADGSLIFQFTSEYLEEVKWPKGHNFTLGGRELKFVNVHLNGMITDVQIFSRKISAEEAVAYTACTKVMLFSNCLK